MHRADGGHVLVDDRICRPTALGDVALQTADEADVRVGIHEELNIKQLAQGWLGKEQDAFDEDDAARLDRLRPLGAAVGGEVIDRHFYRLAVFQLYDVLDEQF